MLRHAIAAWAVLLVPAVAAADGGLTDVSQAGGIHAELRTLIKTWIAAVRERDLEALIEAAAPEARAKVRTALEDPSSDLTKIPFSSSSSVRSRFPDVRELRIYLFAHQALTNLGSGTTGCVSAGPLPLPLPVRESELPSPYSPGPVFCQFFYRADGKWHPSYSYAWPDEGGDV